VTSRYCEEPAESGKAILQHIIELYPDADERLTRKLIGGSIAAVKPVLKKKYC